LLPSKYIAKNWRDAFSDPRVKKALSDLTDVVKDMVADKKEREEFQRVQKELTNNIDLNSFKFRGYDDFIKE
jgi:hypothetical protein